MRHKIFFAAAFFYFCQQQPALAGDAVIRGHVRAEPVVEKKADPGGGAYAERSLSYATFFDYSRLKNVVVYAEPVVADAERTSARGMQVLTIKKNRYGLEFSPAFIAIARRSDLKIDNQTWAAVTLFEGGGTQDRFFIDVPAKTQKNIRMRQIHSYKLYCVEDPESRAHVFVAGPYFALADEEGRYKFSVPEGSYRVTAWHERLPAQTIEATVFDGDDLSLDFVLSVKDLPEVK